MRAIALGGFLFALVLCSHVQAQPEAVGIERLAEQGALRFSREYRIACGELETRLMLEAYDRIHAGQESWSQVDRDLIERGGPLHAGSAASIEFWTTLREPHFADHADPQIRAWHWGLKRKSNPRDQQAIDVIDALLVEMREKGCSPIRIAGLAWEALGLRRNIINDMDNRETRDELTSEAFRWYFEWVAPAGAIPDLGTAGRRYVCEKFFIGSLASNTSERRHDCLRSLRSLPETDPWIRNYATGVVFKEDAWQIRGTRTAISTTPEQFDGFHEVLDRAISALEAAYRIDPLCPEACKELVRTNMPRSSTWRQNGWKWFFRCLEAEIDYDSVWDTMRYALEPKWQGSLEEKIRLCEWADNPVLYHTPLPLQAVYLFDDLDRDIGFDLGIEGGAYSNDRLVTAATNSLEGMIAHDADINVPYAHTAVAYIYWKTGRIKDAARHLREINGKTHRNAHNLLAFQDENLNGLVLPHASAGAEHAALAEEQEAAQDWESALAHWNAARVLCQDANDDLAVAAIDGRMLRAQRQDVLERGDWLELQFDESWSGARRNGGLWTRVDDRTVEVAVAGNTSAVLSIDVFPGEAFEIEADVSFSGDPSWKGSCAAVMFHRGNRVTDKGIVDRACGAWPTVQEAVLGSHFGRTKYYHEPCPDPNDGVYHLRVKVDGNWCIGDVNGVEVGDGVVPRYRPEAEPAVKRIGLGAFSLGSGARARFTNVRVRRILPEPAVRF